MALCKRFVNKPPLEQNKKSQRMKRKCRIIFAFRVTTTHAPSIDIEIDCNLNLINGVLMFCLLVCAYLVFMAVWIYIYDTFD